MADRRINLVIDHWYQCNQKKYGHTPFGWGGKEAKLIQKLLKEFDGKQINHQLVFKSIDYYFSLGGFEEKEQCHSFGFFYKNFQKYLKAVLPTVEKKPTPRKDQLPDTPPDPNALRKIIRQKGKSWVFQFMRTRRFMPKSQYEKGIQIFVDEWPDLKRAIEQYDRPKPAPENTRRQELMNQAKNLIKNG